MLFVDLTVLSRAELSYNITPNAHFAPSVVMSFAVTLDEIGAKTAVEILCCKVTSIILYNALSYIVILHQTTTYIIYKPTNQHIS